MLENYRALQYDISTYKKGTRMGNYNLDENDYELDKLGDYQSAILNNARDMFYYLNAQTGRLDYVSSASEAIIGYTPGEVKSMGVSEIDTRFHPDDLPVITEIASHLSNKTIPPDCFFYTKHRFEHKKGHYVWLCFHRSFISNGDGQLEAMIGCVSDITVEKNKEQSILAELQASLESYKRLCDASFEGVVIHINGRILECNQQFADMFGYSIKEIMKIPGMQLAHPDSRPIVMKYINEKTSSHYEQLCVRKDGTVFPVEVRGKQINIAGKEFRLAVFRDMTNQKTMEQELIEINRKYKQLYDNSQAGLFRTSIASGRVLECNDRIVKILGYSSKEELIENYRPEVHYVDKELRDKFIAEIAKKTTVNGFEVAVFRKDGSICWLRVSAKIFPKEGYIESAAFDITATKLLSDAEKQVLSGILEGMGSREIAAKLKKATRTVEDQRSRIMKKLNVSNVVELAVKALDMGFETDGK